mgnify:CR=1 FL=1
MREILFRGKRVDNNEWVYGFLSKSRDSNHFLSLCIDHEENGVMLSSIVKPKTIGQYTGLTDKNGVKIFEGDIIKAYFQPQNFKNSPYAIGSVIFEKGTFKVVVHVSKNSIEYKVFEKENIAAYSIEHNFLDRYYVLEVIGNIHDNPELAEGLL